MRTERNFALFNAAVSAIALAFLAWLLLWPRQLSANAPELSFLPALNAGLNLTAAALLLAGRLAIGRGSREVHRRLMVAAVAVSALFLVSYIYYHYHHGDTKFPSPHPLRATYLAVLASHVLSSILVPPLVLAALWHAVRERFDSHKKLVRWLWPIWLYVSVTGVAIFLMLRSAVG